VADPPLVAVGDRAATFVQPEENDMGKYFLAWLLGVPAIVLVLIYFFFH
jgi:hypothetical protein